MKKLILVRHAKSSWKHNVIDHERPLNNRGLEDAHLVSKYFSTFKIMPDLLISSDANRAKTTAEIFISTLNISNKIVQYNHEVYDFSGEMLTRTIKSCSKSIDCLMVFGHNHAVTDFANSYGNKIIDNIPTCGVVVIDFETSDWNDIKPGNTIEIISPKDLK
ncbi:MULTISPECIES: histidine phosphatase family protein [unclassified Algibacter]|uniref:SixA phosphatase family protein n=1 Tax=unclassified Algibacter TaxID=2615009 RepID=UPI00131E6EBE|nr:MULTISPECIES: histidine phosphatase family protein [unclassified Algibacter]MCL5128073.1 histidine phosphatase family protein [Algibacter sp. L4_22]